MCVCVWDSACDWIQNSAGTSFFSYFPPVSGCLWSRFLRLWDKPEVFAHVETFSTPRECLCLSVCHLRCICIYSWLLKSFHWLWMQLRQLWSSPQVLSEHTFMFSIWFKHTWRCCIQISHVVVWRMRNDSLLSQPISHMMKHAGAFHA